MRRDKTGENDTRKGRGEGDGIRVGERGRWNEGKGGEGRG